MQEDRKPEDIIGPIPLEDGLLSNQATQHIRGLIESGELREGDRLPAERELAERLGVSRTIVRESIKLLRADGWVRVRVGVGTFVTTPSRNILEGPLSHSAESSQKKIRDLHQAREVLEPAIAAHAAEHATREQVRRMEQAVEEMERYIDNGPKYINADNNFHEALAKATHNSVFQLMLHSIVGLLQEARQLAVSVPGAAERANYHHRVVLEAVKSRDPEAARTAMEDHMSQIASDIQSGSSDNADPGRQ